MYINRLIDLRIVQGTFLMTVIFAEGQYVDVIVIHLLCSEEGQSVDVVHITLYLCSHQL